MKELRYGSPTLFEDIDACIRERVDFQVQVPKEHRHRAILSREISLFLAGKTEQSRLLDVWRKWQLRNFYMIHAHAVVNGKYAFTYADSDDIVLIFKSDSGH